jgi:hypothetical protein
MQRGASLTGVVTDGNGSPLANATVRLITNNWRDTPMSDLLFGRMTQVARPVRTGDDGSFLIEDLEPGVFQLEVRAKGFTKLAQRDVAVLEGVANECPPLVMSQGGSVEGEVRFANGAPVRSGIVVLRSEQGDMWEERTDDSGSFRFAHAVPGRYFLTARPMDEPGSFDSLKHLMNQQTVTIEEGRTHTVSFFLQP